MNFKNQKDHSSGHNKVLGLGWDSDTDVIAISMACSSFDFHLTKRKVLSVLAQLLSDPRGLENRVVVKRKLLMQRLWIIKLTWDTPLEGAVLERTCHVSRSERRVVAHITTWLC